jgi:hypothetical protein
MTFLSSVVLLIETVFFHVIEYVYDYFTAITVISLAILGLGLGAFVAAGTRVLEETLFAICCMGTTVSIYLTAITTVALYPSFWVATFFITFCFFFPGLYIAIIFRNYPSGHAYLYDMAGACLGVVMTVLLYEYLNSEEIILLLGLVIPTTAFAAYMLARNSHWKFLPMVLVSMILFGSFLFYQQIENKSFDLYGVMLLPRKELADWQRLSKVFNNIPSSKKLLASYDNLGGRVDVFSGGVSHRGYARYNVALNGYYSDRFSDRKSLEYENCYKPTKTKWPTKDLRVPYGIVKEPRVFIIGSSADGIIKPVKAITPLKNILPVEINPELVHLMQKDFYEESGEAYKGLNPIVGNALSVMKATKEIFDIITLLNTHSTKNIAHKGQPDYLHTVESYTLYLDHLTQSGYLIIEERPEAEQGRLAIYREINTLCHALQKRGKQDCKQHFVIWEWGRLGDNNERRFSKYHYIMMMVTKEPINQETRGAIEGWIECCLIPLNKRGNNEIVANLIYFNGYKEMEEYADLFRMIESGDFSSLAARDFDASIVTNNRPFVQMATNSSSELVRLTVPAGLGTALLVGVFLLGIGIGSGDRKEALLFGSYSILIGVAYLLIEILLLQVYQNVFISPSWTLVIVLGSLLVSSGIGGMAVKKVSAWIATLFLVPMSVVAVYAPSVLIAADLPLELIKVVSVIVIATVGFVMGIYLPFGLALAKNRGMGDKIPHFFAVNAIGSSFAVVIALLLGMKVGYEVTVGVAAVLYIVAAAAVQKVQTNGQSICS